MGLDHIIIGIHSVSFSSNTIPSMKELLMSENAGIFPVLKCPSHRFDLIKICCDNISYINMNDLTLAQNGLTAPPAVTVLLHQPSARPAVESVSN